MRLSSDSPQRLDIFLVLAVRRAYAASTSTAGAAGAATLDAAALRALGIDCDASKLKFAIDGTFTNPEFLVASPRSEQNGSEYFYQTPTKSEAARFSFYAPSLLHLCTLVLVFLQATFAALP